MLLSFSPTSQTDYAIGDHLRGYPDLISFEVDNYTPETHTYSIVDNEWEWELSVVAKPNPPESPTTKHSRVRQTLITTDNLEDFDLEDEIFSDIEIGEIITAKVWDNNPFAQSVLQMKATLALASQDTTAIQTILSDPRLILTNQIRVKLWLSSLL